tara:strand:+ start:978 stop:1517 length:540 start_codon:yes stop_codon:yes gene_type:complete
MTLTEQFRKVAWAPDYEVSTQGRVRSTVVRGQQNTPSLRYLKGWTKNTGYKMIWIDGETWRVHRLVYRIFVGELVDGMHICHLDGNPANNDVSNLSQETHTENMSHKWLHGTMPVGEANANALHTQEQADAVRAALTEAECYLSGRLKRGERQRIADECGVLLSLVAIIRAKPNSWRPA